MSTVKKLPYSKMTSLDLCSGFKEDGVIVLQMVPTMQDIVYEGRKYLRTASFQVMEDGSQRAMYLWDGYVDELIRRRNVDGTGVKDY